MRCNSNTLICSGSISKFSFRAERDDHSCKTSQVSRMMMTCYQRSPHKPMLEQRIIQTLSYSPSFRVLLAPRNFTRLFCLAFSFASRTIGSITSRCSGKEPALLPRTLFSGRNDTREWQKSSLHARPTKRKRDYSKSNGTSIVCLLVLFY